MDTTRPSLLLRIRDRENADAWRTFDAIYRPMVYRFARARGLVHADAEDVTQQCLAAVAEHIGEFAYAPQKGRFKSWLATIVNNKVRSLHRRRQERHGDTHELAVLRDDAPDPEAAFAQIWLEEHLWHCLAELRSEVEERTFAAFTGYVIAQQPLEEVCAAVGLSPNNVYTIKWRMTERIAQKMSRLLDGME